jgi:hypothetical protein
VVRYASVGALIIYLALVVDSNSAAKPHCGSPGTEVGLLEQLLCVSESIRMRAEDLAEGEIAPNKEGRLALKEESTQKPRTAAEILERAAEVLREGAKAMEQFRRESQRRPQQ